MFEYAAPKSLILYVSANFLFRFICHISIVTFSKLIPNFSLALLALKALRLGPDSYTEKTSVCSKRSVAKLFCCFDFQ